ncbi:MAG: hypothetical protein C6P37_13720 [Caldibacillus debilis]|uniref:Uncharacterized protein n=2 Tax=Caldibacillus debilis TaxID=301148 RepID=A0A3E0K0J0_9BACI|nr:MAG: hypothetical protein C6W56_15020 [Caldibacillus debilis]REJ26383.1 MAG: hypothetical protein C6P37_13720 [Caldibacillus debilis]
MMNGYSSIFKIFAVIAAAVLLSACSKEEGMTEVSGAKTSEAGKSGEQKQLLKNNITLSKSRGNIRDQVEFTVDELKGNQDVELVWIAYEGQYEIVNLYEMVGPKFKEKEVVLAKGKSGGDGIWKGSFTVPEGFGGDHTIFVRSKGEKIGQTVFTVDPTFTMYPKSGPVGTKITIKAEGLGWSTYMRNWQLTYDNKYTGLISAVATNGKAEAIIRAAGPPGKHYIRIRTGYLGMPYINYQQSPHADKPAPEFMFEVTDEPPLDTAYVEPVPEKAGNGLEMPELKNKPGVKVALDKHEGTVGEPVRLTASGLPKNKKAELIWNTMRGSRVSGLGFGEETEVLASVNTDGDGRLSYDFRVPDDLGGIPHRIDVKIEGEIYGQAYLRILPSIVNLSPKSGPAGTKIQITIKGGGWTEFDNAYYLTYDNAYAGYMCAFNSEGDLTFDVVATGQPGYHIIDLYPGIYRQKDKDTDMTLIPQLTYATDHPGSKMPAIRMGFWVTEK